MAYARVKMVCYKSQDDVWWELVLDNRSVAKLVVTQGGPSFEVWGMGDDSSSVDYLQLIHVHLRGTVTMLMPNLSFLNDRNRGEIHFMSDTPDRRRLRAPVRFGKDPDPSSVVDLPRTAITAGRPRTDKLALASAKTPTEVDSALSATHPMSRYVPIQGRTYSSGKAKAPMTTEVVSLRAKLAEAITAVGKQELANAGTRLTELSLPLPEDDALLAPSRMSQRHWTVALSLGMVKLDTSWDSADAPLVAVQGLAHYVTLLNDMAERGVADLKAPPTHDNLLTYLYNLRREMGHEYADARQKALLNAHQAIMTGMVVHYAFASAQDPVYREVPEESWFVFEPRTGVQTGGGLAWRYASKEKAKKAATARGSTLYLVQQQVEKEKKKWIRPTLPTTFDDITSLDTYGYRYESNCAGMALLRLLTLPPGFAPVGVVHGALLKDLTRPAHIVLLYTDRGFDDVPGSGPANLYMSSNGKPPILIERGSSGTYTAAIVEDAVERAFANEYRGSPSASEFSFGISIPRYPPGVRSTSYTPSLTEWKTQLTFVGQRLLLDAYADNTVRRWHKPGQVPDPAWGRLAIP